MDGRQVWGGLDFQRIALIEPARDPAGAVAEFMPQGRYGQAATGWLNHYGSGPFCRFSLRGLPSISGVYVLTSDDQLRYVGETDNLANRWGLRGYGSIQPRNCYAGGQETNCRINNLILDDARRGRRLALYFTESPNRKAVEAQLLAELRPPWNRR